MEEPSDPISQIQSLETSDTPLTVVRIRYWIILLFIVLIVVSSVLWAFMGTIPINANGRAIAFDPATSLNIRAMQGGTVQAIRVVSGDLVQTGDLLATLMDPSGREIEILAPQTGTIDWVGVIRGDVVAPGSILFWLQGIASPKAIKIYGFFPLDIGQLIQRGMKAQVALTAINPSRYGMLEGVVKEILPYPVSPSDFYLQNIPSEQLRNYLIGSSEPVFLVVVEPDLDAATPSSLRWSSKKGPPQPIQSGMLGKMEVRLANEHPISFLVPSLKRGS